MKLFFKEEEEEEGKIAFCKICYFLLADCLNELHHHLKWRSHRTDRPSKKFSIFCFSRAANIYIRFICKQTLKKLTLK